MPAMTRNRMRKRRVGKIDLRPLCLIFCEGKETEPCYFGGLSNAIYADSETRRKIKIEVHPVGEGTIKVVEAAEAYVARKGIEDAQVWCVYDKDDFPDDDFNGAAQKAEQLTKTQKKKNVVYRTAWSNICIEYWFILHFRPYDASNGKNDYYAILNEEFKRLGRAKYKKNDPQLFEVLTSDGDPKNAIHRAEERREACNLSSPAKCCPATTVDELVKELASYLPEKLKQRYL